MRSAAWASGWSIARIAMAGLIAAAIVAQLVRSVSGAIDAGRHVPTIVSNFFSFFTILSNVSAVVALASAGIWFFAHRTGTAPERRWIAVLLACATTYMVITGIVYNILLRGHALEPGAIVPWSNEVLHLFGPLFLAVDLFVGPRRRALSWRTIWAVVAFPIVWVAYTMIRGPFITNPGTGDPYWYPYPFLNPHNPGGWTSVVLYTIGIAVAIVVMAAVVVWWGRRIGSAPSPDAAAEETSEGVPAPAP